MRIQYNRQRGFTLIELMVTVAIVGILAGIAYPAYTNSVLKSRRADGVAKLLQLQMAQESYRVKQAAPSYATTLLQLTGAATLTTDYYSYALNPASATAFTITATATGTQANDTTACKTLVIKETGPDLPDAAEKACWSR